MNESLSTKDAKKLNKASVLSTSDDPRDQDRARARQTDVDYKDLLRQIKARKKKKVKEGFVLEREDSPYEKASDKALDKKYGYGTSHDKGPKTGFGRASNRNTAAAVLKDIRRRKSTSTSDTRADAAHKGWSATARTSKDQTPEKKATRKKLADTPYKKLPKDEQEKDQVAADAVKKEYDKRKKNESFEIDKDAHKSAQKKAKLRNLALGNKNPNEKKSAEKKAGGPKLYGEEDNFSQKDKELKRTKSARNQRYNTLHSGTNTSKNTDVNEGEIADKLRKVIADMKAADRKAGLLPGGKDVIDLDVERVRRRKKKIKEGRTWDSWKKAAASALKKKNKERKAQPATDAGARARRKLKDKEHNTYVNFLSAEDD